MEPPLRVLVVAADDAVWRAVEESLAAERDFPASACRARSLDEAFSLATLESFPIVLLDLDAPAGAGLEALARAQETLHDAAVVVLSRREDDEAALQALKRGAQDALGRDAARGRALTRAVRYAHERRRARAEAERLKEEFLHHVSHELRSPLTAIYQAVQLLGAGIAGEARPEQRRLVDIAVRNSEHLKAMIDDLLETTRAETGKLVVEPRRTDAARLAAEVAAEKRLAADQRGVSLSCAGAAPLVFADPVRVRQVLMNLVDNALKFTPSGGAVALECGVDARQAGMARLSVSDTGPGLPPGDLERVFERLYQAGSVRPASGERKGLGLGLHISREIVLRSGGRIWVESEPGRGARFLFTLPAFRFDDIVGPVCDGGASRAAVAFVELYPPSHGMAEGSARTVRLECAALLRRQAREGEALLPEMCPPGVEGLLVYGACEPPDGGAALGARLEQTLAGARVLQLHRLKAKVDVRVVERGPEGIAAAVEAAVERRIAERTERARASGVVA